MRITDNLSEIPNYRTKKYMFTKFFNRHIQLVNETKIHNKEDNYIYKMTEIKKILYSLEN